MQCDGSLHDSGLVVKTGDCKQSILTIHLARYYTYIRTHIPLLIFHSQIEYEVESKYKVEYEVESKTNMKFFNYVETTRPGENLDCAGISCKNYNV